MKKKGKSKNLRKALLRKKYIALTASILLALAKPNIKAGSVETAKTVAINNLESLFIINPPKKLQKVSFQYNYFRI